MFDRQPHLVGRLIEARPLEASDFEALAAAASDPLIWELHPDRDRHRPEVFRVFFDDQLASGGGLVVLDRNTGEVIGTSRFHGYDPEASEIEIGWTFLVRRYWGGAYNGELKSLMLCHAFQYVKHVLFRVRVGNLRSQRAVEKIGGVSIGTCTDRESFSYRISAPSA
ncbi:MAG TPA: GNAT family N-acetyltransferase [Gaiellaceae bacterium]|nr:GNAT family N-acetyltransferase [Gaiellaceae bacterium]